MKSLIVETKEYGWINRYSLIKDKDEYVLKIRQYKRKSEVQDYSGYNEIHLWGNGSVKKLSQFLNKTLREKDVLSGNNKNVVDKTINKLAPSAKSREKGELI